MARKRSGTDVEKAKNMLASLSEPPPEKVRMSTKKAIEGMEGEIQRALKLGYSLEHIASHLRGTGFEIADSTFRNYWRELKRKSSGASSGASQSKKKTKGVKVRTRKVNPSPKKKESPQPQESEKMGGRKGKGFEVYKDTKEI